VLPDLLSALAASAGDDVTRDALTGAAEHGMGKGEVLVAHVRGTGEASQVVAVERHGAA
jgi:8-oxo-dGTP diphosphatase